MSRAGNHHIVPHQRQQPSLQNLVTKLGSSSTRSMQQIDNQNCQDPVVQLSARMATPTALTSSIEIISNAGSLQTAGAHDIDSLDQCTEKMNSQNQVTHRSLNSARTVPQNYPRPLSQTLGDSLVLKDAVRQARVVEQARAAAQYQQQQEDKDSFTRYLHHEDPDHLDVEMEQYLKVQSQKVSLVGRPLGLELGNTTSIQTPMTTENSSQYRQKSITPTPQMPPTSSQHNQLQNKLVGLEQRVSSLVLSIEQLRPLAKEAKRVLGMTQGNRTTRSRPGSQNRQRSASKDGIGVPPGSARGGSRPQSIQQLQAQWVASTNISVTQRRPQAAAANGRRVTTAGRSRTPILREAPPSARATDVPKNEIEALMVKVSSDLANSKSKLKALSDAQRENVEAHLIAQQTKLASLDERLQALNSKKEIKQLRKEQRRQARKAEKARMLEQMKDEMVASVVAELKEQEASSIGVLDQATRDYIAEHSLNTDSSVNHNSAMGNKGVMTASAVDEIDQVIEVDLQTVNSERLVIKSSICGPESKLSQSPQKKLPLLDEINNNSYSSAEQQSNLSNPAKVLQRSGAIPSGFVDQIELALEKLESYSLRSSEDINDSIEQLVACFNSNTAALQRALEDLKHQRSQQSNTQVCEAANKILHQFENFAEYTRGEVAGVLGCLEERGDECRQSMELLEGDLIPAQSKHDAEHAQLSVASNQAIRFEAAKEHLNALKQHIMNTQQFLERETKQIEVKVDELQVSVVKDIESMFTSGSNQPVDGSRMSVISSVSQSTTSFLEQAAAHPILRLSATKPQLPPFTPSKDLAASESAAEAEISILCSPVIACVLKSQISTIPEEEIDTEYAGGHGDQQSSAQTTNYKALGSGTDFNNTYGPQLIERSASLSQMPFEVFHNNYTERASKSLLH